MIEEKRMRDAGALWVQIAAPVVASVVASLLVAFFAAGFGLWRDQPITGQEVNALKSDTSALRLAAEAHGARIAALEATDKQRGAELLAIQRSVEEIKGYSGRTMSEVTEIKIQLAEIRGESSRKK